MITANPFSELPAIGSGRSRDRVLSDDELSRVWRAAEATPGPYGKIVRMLILTGQRESEVAEMPWCELNEDLSIWTIPGERTKNHLTHFVPLSEPVRAILSAQPQLAGELVFPGERPGQPVNSWSKSKARLDSASGVTGWRLHDLRRTAATGMQRLGVPLQVTEASMNHIGSRAGIVAVYQRHDYAAEKGAALTAWAQHLAEILAK